MQILLEFRTFAVEIGDGFRGELEKGISAEGLLDCRVKRNTRVLNEFATRFEFFYDKCDLVRAELNHFAFFDLVRAERKIITALENLQRYSVKTSGQSPQFDLEHMTLRIKQLWVLTESLQI